MSSIIRGDFYSQQQCVFYILICHIYDCCASNLTSSCQYQPALWKENRPLHYDDVIMTMLASQITSLTVVYSIVYSGVNQRRHQSSASLAFVREIHRGPVNFPRKWPVTRKMFPFDDVIMVRWLYHQAYCVWLSNCLGLVADVIDEYILEPAHYWINLSWNQYTCHVSESILDVCTTYEITRRK